MDNTISWGSWLRLRITQPNTELCSDTAHVISLFGWSTYSTGLGSKKKFNVIYFISVNIDLHLIPQMSVTWNNSISWRDDITHKNKSRWQCRNTSYAQEYMIKCSLPRKRILQTKQVLGIFWEARRFRTRVQLDKSDEAYLNSIEFYKHAP